MTRLRPKIPATVITGFLGAGKTTLVRHILENAGGRRIALIVNEFGDIGVDGELLKSCGIAGCRDEDVVELANGCLCCTVADEFLPTMRTLVERDAPPDHIVIETSGLALPKPLVKAFDWPEIRSRVTVDGVVAVVDGAAVADGRFADDMDALQAGAVHDNPLEEVFEDQLACADIVLLNKADLLDEAALQAVTAEVAARLRGGVRALPSRHGKVDLGVLLGLEAAVEDDLAARPSHHDTEDGHDHDDFESFAVAVPAVSDLMALEARLAAALRDFDILRLKGFLHVAGKDMRHVVQAVGTRLQRYYDRPWGAAEPRDGRLVVIGLKGLPRAAIAAAILG